MARTSVNFIPISSVYYNIQYTPLQNTPNSPTLVQSFTGNLPRATIHMPAGPQYRTIRFWDQFIFKLGCILLWCWVTYTKRTKLLNTRATYYNPKYLQFTYSNDIIRVALMGFYKQSVKRFSETKSFPWTSRYYIFLYLTFAIFRSPLPIFFSLSDIYCVSRVFVVVSCNFLVFRFISRFPRGKEPEWARHCVVCSTNVIILFKANKYYV